MSPSLIPTAEPFFFPGGPVGCLLVHGFTGTPKEMRWMGEYMAEQGFTVLGIRLPGHATQIDDMLRMRWEDWLAAVEDGWHILKGACSSIYLMGLSMGGILSLLFAARQKDVAGVVAMSVPNIISKDWRVAYLEYFYRIQPKAPKGPPDWHDLEAGREHIDYPYYPTRALIQLRDLAAEMRRSLPSVQVPVLMIHSKEDTGVLPENMEANFAALGAQQKEMLWVENSGHVITREPERQTVFLAAADFVRKVESTRT